MTAQLRSAPSPQKTETRLRAVLFGCGVVNSGVLETARMLPRPPAIEAVVTRRGRAALPDGVIGLTEIGAGFDIGPDLVVEALPDCADAERVLARAVESRTHVVSANKAVLARRPDLEERAREQGTLFAYSAAVGGGVPVLETLARLRQARCEIERVEGVVNGTTNFVIDAVIDGASIPEAIGLAQSAGFAEADPSADLDGRDAAAKLALIARAAFDLSLDPLDVEQDAFDTLDEALIRRAAECGLRYRQVARLERDADGVRAEVRLLAVAETSPLARPRREENVFEITCKGGLSLSLHGKGAGREPTASAVLADIAGLIESLDPQGAPS